MAWLTSPAALKRWQARSMWKSWDVTTWVCLCPHYCFTSSSSLVVKSLLLLTASWFFNSDAFPCKISVSFCLQKPFVILPFSLLFPLFLLFCSCFLPSFIISLMPHRDPYFLFLKAELELNSVCSPSSMCIWAEYLTQTGVGVFWPVVKSINTQLWYS